MNEQKKHQHETPGQTQRKESFQPGQNQGEGNKEADRHYRESTREFIDKDDVGKRGKEAAEALEGKEREALEKAEAEGRRRAKGSDPEVSRER